MPHIKESCLIFGLVIQHLGSQPVQALRHFQADSHLISWLHNQQIDYDIITDDELDRDGLAAIAGYKAVMTGTHPEYHTRKTLDALESTETAVVGLFILR